MKASIDFNFYMALCLSMAEKINKLNNPVLIGINRGGLIPATIIAKELRLPVNIYTPGKYLLQFSQFSNHSEKNTFVFIEDLVAKGRTYHGVASFMENNFPNVEWEFCPVLVDGKLDLQFQIYGLKTDTWIVMPWEKEEKVVDGDRGLFRDGTDAYGRA